MNLPWTVFDQTTGAIIKTMLMPENHRDLNIRPGQGYVPGTYSRSDYYILAGEPTPRADYTLGALPLPCTVTIEGVAYAVTEQPEFVFPLAGQYTVSVDAGPAYLQKEFVIDYYP